MTADAPYVAEVAEAMARRYYGSTAFDQFSDGGKAEALSSCWADATVAVETLTPLIRAQERAKVAAEIRAVNVRHLSREYAARIAEGPATTEAVDTDG